MQQTAPALATVNVVGAGACGRVECVNAWRLRGEGGNTYLAVRVGSWLQQVSTSTQTHLQAHDQAFT
jgi:hypothetical protein